ncbi:MAG: ABC transporter substrate-binding protein [Bauldia sp.]|nr:ABC transporter substrate-binding protein [Bauldia sp.]
MPVGRRQFLLGAAGSLFAAVPVLAQGNRAGKLVAVMIGALPPPDATGSVWADAVAAGLGDRGWRVGTNLGTEFRFTAGQNEATARFASELLAMEPDVIVTGTPANSEMVDSLSRTIPQVFVAVPDPIASGLIESYARPGGHATGVTHLEPSIGGKMVDLLMAVAPNTNRVAYLTNPDTIPSPMLPFVAEAAAGYGLQVEAVHVRSVEEIAPAIATIAGWATAGIVMPPNNWVHNNAAAFVEPINAHRIPAIYPAHRMVDAGGLLGVGVEIVSMFRLGGDYAGRILNGAAPQDLPVQAAPFSTMLNLATADRLGLTLPVSLLVAVDRFIE